MSTNEFDELLKGTFDQNDFAYNPEHWNRLSRQLTVVEKKQPRIVILWLPLMGIAASLALFATACLFLYKSEGLYRHSKDLLSQQQSVVHNYLSINSPTQKTSNLNNDITPAFTPAPATSISPITFRKPVIIHTSIKQNKNMADLVLREATQQVLPDTDKHLSLQAHLFAKNDEPLLPSLSITNKHKEDQSPATTGHIYNLALDPGILRRKKENTNVSLAGGINYGTLNTGYMIGATSHKMLGKKLYLEGDVAYVSNSNTIRSESTPSNTYATGTGTSTGTTTINNYNQPSLVTGPPPQPMALVVSPSALGRKPTGTSGSSNAGNSSSSTAPIVTPTHATSTSIIHYDQYQYTYMQLAPMLGYNVHKHVSIGIGADFQQLLLDNQPENSTNSTTDQIKTVPNVDLGFIGKTEYVISSKVRAGLMYRGDINTILGNSKYIDRSYVQFQLKFTIINK